MPEITIFTALGWERRALVSALHGVRPGEAPRTWTGHLGDGTECLVLQTGMGPERAASAAARAPRSRLFLGCGCAGGLAPWLEAGDVVAADAVSVFDAGGRAGETFAAL